MFRAVRFLLLLQLTLLIACVGAFGADQTDGESQGAPDYYLGPDPFRTYRAAQALSGSEKEGAQAYLEGLLSDRTPLHSSWTTAGGNRDGGTTTAPPNTSPATAAANSLGSIGDATAVGPLKRLYRNGKWYEKEAALEAIGSIDGKNNVGLFVSALRVDAIAESTGDVLRGIIYKDPIDISVIAALHDALDTNVGGVRAPIIEILSDVHDPVSAPFLGNILRNHDHISDKDAIDGTLEQILEFQKPKDASFFWVILGWLVILFGGCGFIAGIFITFEEDLYEGLPWLAFSSFAMIMSYSELVVDYYDSTEIDKMVLEGELDEVLLRIVSTCPNRLTSCRPAYMLVGLPPQEIFRVIDDFLLNAKRQDEIMPSWILSRKIFLLRSDPELIELVMASSPTTMSIIARTIGEMGLNDKALISLLMTLSRNSDSKVRDAASRSLSYLSSIETER
jgi:hypothetical protein